MELLSRLSVGHSNLQRLCFVIQVNGKPIRRILTLEQSCSVDPFGNQLIGRSDLAQPHVLQSKTMIRSRQVRDGRITVVFSSADKPDQLIVDPKKAVYSLVFGMQANRPVACSF